MYRLVVTPDNFSDTPDEYEIMCADVYSLRATFDHHFAMAVQHAEYERIEAYTGDKMIALYNRKGIK